MLNKIFIVDPLVEFADLLANKVRSSIFDWPTSRYPVLFIIDDFFFCADP